jgi:hypothetical protein
MQLNFQKARHQQIISILLVLAIMCFYDYQMIYLVTKPATGILLLAHVWMNASSICGLNLFLRFGGSSQQKRDAIFGIYLIMVMMGLIIYLLSIPAIIYNPMGIIMLVSIIYVTTEMFIDNLLQLLKKIKSANHFSNTF